MVFDENVFDEIDHFHPNFDESVPNQETGLMVLDDVCDPIFLVCGPHCP